MAASQWIRQDPPDRGADSVPVGRWRPATPAEISAARRRLSAGLHDGARPPAAVEGAVERLLLAFEELASNALRHGRLPVEVSVTRTGWHWVLEVSDAAADRLPTPAIGRDPALGGLGLHLVAQMSSAHGWTVAGSRKVVWACIDYTRAGAPGAAPIPRPRDVDSRDVPTH
jgi:hypothetical protein